MNTSTESLRVVGALIERDGCYLLTKRPASSSSWPGAWEFPGGKVEEGESDERALHRELFEELGIKAQVGELFMEVLDHDEGARSLDLRIYRCVIGLQEPRTLGVDEIRWLRAGELPGLHFPTADRPVVEALIDLDQKSKDAPLHAPGRIAP